jgi:hypothetical protein
VFTAKDLPDASSMIDKMLIVWADKVESLLNVRPKRVRFLDC